MLIFCKDDNVMFDIHRYPFSTLVSFSQVAKLKDFWYLHSLQIAQSRYKEIKVKRSDARQVLDNCCYRELKAKLKSNTCALTLTWTNTGQPLWFPKKVFILKKVFIFNKKTKVVNAAKTCALTPHGLTRDNPNDFHKRCLFSTKRCLFSTKNCVYFQQKSQNCECSEDLCSHSHMD